jgi:glycosyltransferase involved in cell wall biosynthesis
MSAPPDLPHDVPAGLFHGEAESFGIAAMSPGLDPAAVVAVVCVPTYRRPDLLAATLRSLAAQQGAPPFAVIVAENEGSEREGARVAAAMLDGVALQGVVLVEPAQGNCNAYNAAWRCALTRFPDALYICGIDDDELADPAWLAQLVRAAQISDAGIIGGSVTPVFENAAGEGWRGHPVFRSHYAQSGPVPIIYSSANYLIRREVIIAAGYPFLDPAFNFMGGGDTDFFTRAKARGVRFEWRQEAGMTEIMPARRTEWSWISARAWRNGMISALIEKKADDSFAGFTRRVARSLALLAASPLRGVRLALETGSARTGLYHAQVALGRIGAEFGMVIEQYRNPEKN